MLEKKTMPVTFYLIAEHLTAEESFKDVVDRIMHTINGGLERYTEQRLSDNDFGKFSIRVFHATKQSRPRWRPFISNFVAQDSSINKCFILSQSFLLFVSYNNKVFAVTGGAGSFEIDPFVSQTFGMDIITRLIEKNSPVIKSLQHRRITGILLGQTKQFRADRKLAEETQFGQIYKEVSAQLDKKLLVSVLGFKAAELKREVTGCLARSSFRINKSLGDNEFFRIIKRFDILLDKPANFSINSVELISRKKMLPLIAQLEETRLRLLYNSYLNDLEPDFDFTNKELDKYLNAVYYRICLVDESIDFDFRPTFKDIQKKLKKKDRILCSDVFEFKHSVLKLMIESMDADGKVLTRGTIESHLHGEVDFEGRTYFIIDGEWYRVSSRFIKDLNDELKPLLEQHWDDKILTNSFDQLKREGEYNLSFIGTPGTLVFDTVVPENIEACDILKYSTDMVCLIHVKKGFNNMIRDLAAQVLMAAKRLENDINSGFTYIKKLESMTKAGKHSKSQMRRALAEQTFPDNGLLDVFKGKKTRQICFCLAFVDVSEEQRNLKDNLVSFGSNIAKYSLLELIKEITAIGFDFRVIQLNREDQTKSGKAGDIAA